MTEEEFTSAVRYATKGVIFDTNVLLAYLIGLWDIEELARFKRTSAYGQDDFRLLAAVAEKIGKLVTTPHVLTEACNLSDTFNKNHGFKIYGMIAELLKQTTIKERRQESVHLVKDALFEKFGLADMSLVDASRRHHMIVTDDAACYAAIKNTGGCVLNINHLRGARWLAK